MAKEFLATKYKKHPKYVEEVSGKLVSKYLEVNNGPTLVDKAFIPMEVQVRQAIAAGENLHGFKLAQYHAMHPDQIPDDYYDPLCMPNYDPTDAQQDLQRIAIRAWEARKVKLAKEARKEKEDPNVVDEGNGQNKEGDDGVIDTPVDPGANGTEGKE